VRGLFAKFFLSYRTLSYIDTDFDDLHTCQYVRAASIEEFLIKRRPQCLVKLEVQSAMIEDRQLIFDRYSFFYFLENSN